MGDLLIRGVDDALRRQLEAQAAANHRSLEDEAREALRQAVAHPVESEESLIQLAARLFGPVNGIELELPPRHASRPPPDFSGPEFDR